MREVLIYYNKYYEELKKLYKSFTAELLVLLSF